jgi:spermidine synthase
MGATATEATIVGHLETQTESARSLLFFLFFISGFAALTYQVVWQRALFAFYGINAASVTVVVSAFMLGLGLGSLLGGYLSTLAVPLIAIFGLAELGTAAFGFFSLRLFHHVAVHTAGASTLTTGILAFALVLVPTVLMGSTLPVLVTYCVRVIPNIGRWTGALYYVNTLGSALACILAGMFTMRLLGESGSVRAAACINAVVGTVALVYHFARGTSARSGERISCEPTKQSAELLPFWLGVIVSACSGLIALAYEILWYRVFAFATATRSETFPYLLGMYLLGIAFGSLLAEYICRTQADLARQRRLLGLLIAAGNLVAFALAPATSYFPKAAYGPLLGLALIPIAALLLGTIFPLTCNLVIAADYRAGSRVSLLYFSNIVGCTVGAFGVGYLALDFLSTAQLSVALAAFGTLLGLMVLAWRDHRGRRWAGALALVAVMVIAIVWPSFASLYRRLLPRYDGFTGDFQYLIENKSGVIGVMGDGTVVGGGAYDGMFNTDPLHDGNGIFRAYAVSALHHRPREVLMIGLSSGSWAQVLVNHPDVEHLTIVEINPAYLELIPRYPQVRSLLSNPKITIDIDDGRRWLHRNPDAKFDAVVMNSTLHWRANMTNLLSTEFLQLVREHLKPGGIFYYNATNSPEALLTAATVFPYAVRVWTFVAVSDSPIEVSKLRWLDRMQRYMIDGRPVLDPADASANATLLNTYARWVDESHNNSDKQMIEYADTLRARYKGRTIITDDNMACEWR